MLTAGIIYLIGFMLIFGIIALEDLHNCDFKSPFFYFGIIAGLTWPLVLVVFVLVSIVEAMNKEIEES